MHLVATNICLWIRTIIWESANEWIHHIYKQKMNLLSSLGNEVASEPINDFNGPVALGLRSADTGLRDSYTNNYFSDRSFTNLDKYEVVDSLSTADAAKLGSFGEQPKLIFAPYKRISRSKKEFLVKQIVFSLLCF